MKKDNILYEYVYDSLVTQIYRGHYKYGDFLPSFQYLCEEFGVSNITVRKAIHLLVENQYVAAVKSKHFRVDFDILNPAFQQGYISELRARKKAIDEVYHIMWDICPTLFVEGAKQCGENDLAKLQEMVGEINPWTQSMLKISQIVAACITCLVAKLKNPLISDFVEKMMQFSIVSYMPGFNLPHPFGVYFISSRKYYMEVIRFIRDGEYTALEIKMRDSYIRAAKNMQKYILGIVGQQSIEHTVPFRWRIDEKITWISMELVSGLLKKIVDGTYQTNMFLPSPAILTGQYGMRECAVRRTLSVLSEMGITETINGKGTRVKCNDFVLFGQVNHQSAYKIASFYIYSMEFIVLTSRRVAREILACLDEPSIKALEEQLASDTLSERTILDWMVDQMKNETMQAIYRQFSQVLVLGYFINDISGEQALINLVHQQSICLVEQLKQNRADEFAETFHHLYHTIYCMMKKRVEEVGIMDAAAFPPLS